MVDGVGVAGLRLVAAVVGGLVLGVSKQWLGNSRKMQHTDQNKNFKIQ